MQSFSGGKHAVGFHAGAVSGVFGFSTSFLNSDLKKSNNVLKG